MLNSILKFRELLERADITRLCVLLAIIVSMALLEVVGIASILPFLHLAANPDALQQHQWLRRIFDFIGFATHREMLVACGWSVIGFLTFSNILAVASIWQRQCLAWSMSHSVSMKLVRAYASLPYDFFLKRNSADLIKKIIADVNGLVIGVLLAGSQFLSQVVVSLAIFVLLLVVQPSVAFVAISFFAGMYLIIYYSRRKTLTQLGRDRLDADYIRFKTFVELITGIKAVKTDGAEDHFIHRFEKASQRYSEIHPKVDFISSVPRYIVETIALAGVVGIVLYLATSDGNVIDALPTLTLFVLAGYRLMPALNGAYTSIARVLSSYPAIESIYDDVHASRVKPHTRSPLPFVNAIQLQQVSFRYDPSEPPVVDGVTLSVSKGEKIAFVGPTGSGKTTLVDLLMGLLSPQSGRMLVDKTEVNEDSQSRWQALIGYVPQEVFLYDATIAKNIAFASENVDMHRVREVCKIAQMETFIEGELVEGYDTEIGERGVRLSGGQRQRLGIARALYRQPDVLILDEATSALDNLTEEKVVQSIHQFLPNVTMIMIAHRLSTVRNCDRLYLVDRGKMVAHGDFDELLESSKLFRELASPG